LGDSEVGKTSFLKLLVEESFGKIEKKEKVEKTEGCDFHVLFH
jgi:GTPase SAR1 family protein